MTLVAAGPLSILLAGDLVLDEPDGAYWLAGIAPAVRSADLAIGHLEVPHTRRLVEEGGDVPAPGAPPENIAAIRAAGFGMVSLAGNHIADCGAGGIADTIDALAAAGIAHSGAGADLAAARRPAFADLGSRRVALLSYNCVGPEASWAGEARAGSAYLPIATSDGSPVRPVAPLERVTEEARDILARDLAAVRGMADIVIVALHKGIVHTPARLAPYEREIAFAAIDAGADAVAGHHAHIVRGVEFHRGRPIFHGLGNACVVTRALSPDAAHPKRAEWAARRKQLFGFEPDPAYTLAPFHPEAVNAMLGILHIDSGGAIAAAMLPIDVLPPGRPQVAQGARAGEIQRYVERITTLAGLPSIRIDAAGGIVAA
jgi:poly-gamma-glutamate capsule biosynthesis protein CapA/YwtB (metallophosphatase superfamily)